jgi:hypothetical protein
MAVERQCDVDFSDSDLLVSQLGGKVRLSQVKKENTQASEAARRADAQPREEAAISSWRPLVGKLFLLVPFVVLAWFLLASR